MKPTFPTIPIAIYNTEVAVVDNADQMRELLHTYLGSCEESQLDDADVRALSYHLADTTGQSRFVMFFDTVTPEIIAHESSHMADYILAHVGVPLTIDNTEARAYLLGYLVHSLTEILHG